MLYNISTPPQANYSVTPSLLTPNIMVAKALSFLGHLWPSVSWKIDDILCIDFNDSL